MAERAAESITLLSFSLAFALSSLSLCCVADAGLCCLSGPRPLLQHGERVGEEPARRRGLAHGHERDRDHRLPASQVEPPTPTTRRGSPTSSTAQSQAALSTTRSPSLSVSSSIPSRWQWACQSKTSSTSRSSTSRAPPRQPRSLRQRRPRRRLSVEPSSQESFASVDNNRSHVRGARSCSKSRTPTRSQLSVRRC